MLTWKERASWVHRDGLSPHTSVGAVNALRRATNGRRRAPRGIISRGALRFPPRRFRGTFRGRVRRIGKPGLPPSGSAKFKRLDTAPSSSQTDTARCRDGDCDHRGEGASEDQDGARLATTRGISAPGGAGKCPCHKWAYVTNWELRLAHSRWHPVLGVFCLLIDTMDQA